MRNTPLRSVLYLIACSALLISCDKSSQNENGMTLGTFGAFYTKIESGEEFEQYSRTGDFADIIVDLAKDNSKLVFWRGSSYLPYLETNKGKWYVDEVIPRKGNGDGMMPDRINAYSHVKIIESTAERVVVHWRYLPEFSGLNPHLGVDSRNFVDEYFSITADGMVTRSIRQGTEKTDDWKNPKKRITQTFDLKSSGIKNVSTTEPGKSEQATPIQGAPLTEETVKNPALWWRFDEAQGDHAMESMSGQESEIYGHKSL